MVEAANLLTWERADRCRLDVDPAHRAAEPIPRLLFGKFTEHLGRNIYNGQWAQVLRNPSFERWNYFARTKKDLPGVYRQVRPLVPELVRSDPDEVAAWWLAFGKGEVRYELDRHARNSELCQRIEVARVDSPTVGVEQPIFLPTHRTGRYQASLWVRTKGAGGRLHLAVVARDGRPLGSAVAALPGTEWTELQMNLAVDQAQTKAGEPLLFRVGVGAPTTVWLDEVLLFPADHVAGFDPDVVRLLKESRLPLLRWPGGNFASGYHWKDGVGPLIDRPYRHNRPWNMAEYNHVGTDEFLAFCRAVGCEPLLCVNAGEGTPREAADWVEYCNGTVDTKWGARRAANGHPEPYHVRYWEIGNELYGAWQIGHCTAKDYAHRYRAFAEAMRAVDPGVLLIANGNDPKWNETVLRADKDILRSLSLHTLIGGEARRETDPEKVYLALMAYPVSYAHYLRRLGNQMLSAGVPPKIAITEMQIFTNRPDLPNNSTLTEALWVACLLNVCARTGGEVELVTHSALVNHGGGLRKVNEIVYPTPVHWCHYLYGTAADTYPVPVSLRCPAYDSPGAPGIPAVEHVPYLDCLALTDREGNHLSFFLVNRHPAKDLPVVVNVAGMTARKEAVVSTLTGESYMSGNDWRAPDRVKPVTRTSTFVNGQAELTCPKHSLVRVEVER